MEVDTISCFYKTLMNYLQITEPFAYVLTFDLTCAGDRINEDCCILGRG